tara:strand:- start:299 stop:622 length:324 start_codon:yes stop_codon:yes gene_type:complete
MQNINIFLNIEIEKMSTKVSFEIKKCIVDNINKSRYDEIHKYCKGIKLINKTENIVPIKMNRINPKNKSGTCKSLFCDKYLLDTNPGMNKRINNIKQRNVYKKIIKY